MSFREKSAWISLASLLIVFGVYFWNVARIIARKTALSDFPLFFSLLVALIVAEVVLHLLIAMQSPGDARTPKDERERLIELKATRIAFFVLLVGALVSIATMHLKVGVWVMAHCVLLSVVVAEVVKFGTQIILYRRDT
jgi:hypothetical protein